MGASCRTVFRRAPRLWSWGSRFARTPRIVLPSRRRGCRTKNTSRRSYAKNLERKPRIFAIHRATIVASARQGADRRGPDFVGRPHSDQQLAVVTLGTSTHVW